MRDIYFSIKDITGLLLLSLAAALLYLLACEQKEPTRAELTSVDGIFDFRDTMPADGLQPAALRVVPGNSWTLVTSGDSIIAHGFAELSQDSSNGKQLIITDEATLDWLIKVLPDSFNLASYSDTLRVSNDTLYISGQSTGFYIGGTSGAVAKKSTTFVIATTASGDSADYYTDGTADQVQLQAAINALPSEGGSILLREGQYNFSASANITGSSGSGAKKILIQGTIGTVISIANGQTGINVNTTITTGHGNNQDLAIRDIRFEGLTDDATAIYLEDVHLAMISGNTFVGDSLTAISMKRTNNTKIQGNFFNKVKRGIYGLCGSVLGDDLEDIAIIGNDFSYCHWSAIHLESTSDIWQRDVSKIAIIGNNIEESDFASLYKFAIYLKNSKGSTIVGNAITQTLRGGAIELQDGSLNVISSNIFRENGIGQLAGDSTSTVMLRSSDRNVFIGNTISNEDADYGFTWISSSNNEFIGNISELDSLTTYRQFGGANNIVWSNSGGGGGGSSFDPTANIAFTGANTHTGTETFDGIDRVMVRNTGSLGAYLSAEATHSTTTSAGFKTWAHGGSIASPTSTLSGQFLGLWSARGVSTTSLNTGASAYLGFIADSNWGSGDNPSRAVIATTPDGSATAAVRMYIADDGDVSLGASAPATSARLDITGTGALLLPRVTTAQKNALTAVNGMLVYDTDLNRLEAYENGSWVDL